MFAFFAIWTLLAALILGWWLADGGEAGPQIIQLDASETKTWRTRLEEGAALFRLHFHWALPWMLLAPYVIWLGTRFPFEPARWRSRSAALVLTAGVFVFVSQTLRPHVAPRQAVVVMVNYSTSTNHQDMEMRMNAAFRDAPPVRITDRVATLTITNASGTLSDVIRREISTLHRDPAEAEDLPSFLKDLRPPPLPLPDGSSLRRWPAVLDALACVALLGLAHAGVYHRRYRDREQQAAAMQARLNEARLHALQAQLHPHFLFNTLNGIATLLRRDPAAAEEMLTSLSDLLRIALSGSDRQTIPLREELDFLDRYLAIQQMRFGDRLRSEQTIAPDTLECLVPALVLQPLVENAIRHGIEPSGRPGCVRVTAACTAGELALTVEDNGLGLAPLAQEKPGTGLGLSNVRERLMALYGDTHTFRLEQPPAGGAIVHLRIPIRGPAPSSLPAALPSP